jgi:phosphatidylglycerophosphatase A
VVIDEVAGQWLALLPAALDLRLFAVAFLAFRFFDIVKVWPARAIDRDMKGGWGIVLDDIVAGLYAAALTYAVAQVWPAS